MIDKSIRADYAIQGGGPNYLGKQKMVKAPKKWQSSPDHEPAELAYITEKEKDILIDLDIYGSLNGKPNRGPSGIISLQGDLGGYDASPSGSRNGGNRNGGGHHHRDPTPAPTVTRSRIQEEKQKQFEEDQKARVKDILTRGGVEDRISRGAVHEIDPETGKYNAEAIQKAAKTQARERALGIGTPLTTEEITSLPLGINISDLVPTQEKDTRTLTQKLTQPILTKEGITKTATDFAKKQAINLAAQKAGLSGVLSFANPLMSLYGFLGGGKKDPLRGIRKQISKFKKSDIDTQKESTKKLVKHEPKDGDGEATIAKLVAGEENVIAKAINQYRGTQAEDQIANLVKTNLNQALQYYSMMTPKIEAGKANKQEMDAYELLGYYLNEAAPKQQNVAYGGRIDKALGGRSRDI